MKNIYVVENYHTYEVVAFEKINDARKYMLKVYVEDIIPKLKEYTDLWGEKHSIADQIHDDMIQLLEEDFIEEVFSLRECELREG